MSKRISNSLFTRTAQHCSREEVPSTIQIQSIHLKSCQADHSDKLVKNKERKKLSAVVAVLCRVNVSILKKLCILF